LSNELVKYHPHVSLSLYSLQLTTRILLLFENGNKYLPLNTHQPQHYSWIIQQWFSTTWLVASKQKHTSRGLILCLRTWIHHALLPLCRLVVVV